MFSKALLIGKYLATQAASVRHAMRAVADTLSAAGIEVTLESLTAQGTGIDAYPTQNMDTLSARAQRFDLAVVVGGDGTMLWAARRLAALGVPMIGINQGRLGFITDIALDNFAQVLRPMLKGEFETESRSLLQAQVWREQGDATGKLPRVKECVLEAVAMNDVVVNRGATSGMVELRISVDGAFVADQRADGLIISTSTGSTAYALSAGGSLLHPNVAGWILVPIAPHRLSNRPIVLPDSCTIEIEVLSGRDASANFDMQGLANLMLGDKIVVKRAALAAKFLHPKGWNYFDTLRQKLHWNEG